MQERLSNREFIELIPHLQTEELFLIEILKETNWIQLFGIIYRNKKINLITCNICQENSDWSSFESHLESNKHKMALGKVEQFFHPIYTYEKKFSKIAKGQSVSDNELKQAMAETSESANKFLNETHNVRRGVEEIKRLKIKSDFEKFIFPFALNSDVKKPDDMSIEVTLSLAELLKVEFKTKNGWNPVVKSESNNSNGKFFCSLCSKNCFGVITLNSHIKGFLHKSLQLDVDEIRSPTFKHLNKKCSIQIDNKSSFFIRRPGRDNLVKEALKYLNSKFQSQFNRKEYNLEDLELFDDYSFEVNDKDIDDSILNKLNFEENYEGLSSNVLDKAKALTNTTNFSSQNPVTEGSNPEIEEEGLIGVEYVVKLQKTDMDESFIYECGLCDIDLSEYRMQGHLIGYNHRLKYCELHYPDTMTKLKNGIGHMKYYDFFCVMGTILCRLARAIEDHHGRSAPYVIYEEHYARTKREIMEKIFNYRHACQEHGPSFSNIFSDNELSELRRNKSNYKPPHVPPHITGRFTLHPEKAYLKQREESFISRNEDLKRVKPYSQSGSSQHQEERQWLKSKSPENITSYKPSKSSHSSGIEVNDDWQSFREETTAASRDIEYAYEDYRKNPESHPLYEQEWNLFWRRRKEELILQGLNHRSYNYQPEWVQYFRNRLEQFYEEAIHDSKMVAKPAINMPMDVEEVGYSNYESQINSRESENYTKSYKKTSHPLELSEPQPKKVRYERESHGSSFRRTQAVAEETNVMHSMDYKASWNPEPPTVSEPRQSSVRKPDDKPNVIHVLRLMTAVEDYLGSLAGKIMDLLSHSLVLEKNYINNPLQLEKKILTSSNCVLIETALEKLKGVLYAGLLDDHKIPGFERVIQYTTGLLKHVDKMGFRKNTEEIVKKTEDNSELRRLFEVIQEKKLVNSNQKSLSDTLMDFISFQRKDEPNVITEQKIPQKPQFIQDKSVNSANSLSSINSVQRDSLKIDLTGNSGFKLNSQYPAFSSQTSSSMNSNSGFNSLNFRSGINTNNNLNTMNMNMNNMSNNSNNNNNNNNNNKNTNNSNLSDSYYNNDNMNNISGSGRNFSNYNFQSKNNYNSTNNLTLSGGSKRNIAGFNRTNTNNPSILNNSQPSVFSSTLDNKSSGKWSNFRSSFQPWTSNNK